MPPFIKVAALLCGFCFNKTSNVKPLLLFQNIKIESLPGWHVDTKVGTKASAHLFWNFVWFYRALRHYQTDLNNDRSCRKSCSISWMLKIDDWWSFMIFTNSKIPQRPPKKLVGQRSNDAGLPQQLTEPQQTWGTAPASPPSRPLVQSFGILFRS